MADCSRCGQTTDERPSNSDYAYCDGCMAEFENVRENGVTVRYLVNGANTLPEGYYVLSSDGDQYAGGQTEALAIAKDTMEKIGARGVFEYRPTQSRWLIDEYLEAHPSIASDVDSARKSGPLSKLFG